MRVLFINSVCGIGSTGRICAQQAQSLAAEGHEVKIAYGRSDTVPEEYERFAVRIGNAWDMRLHGLKTRLFDGHGFGSKHATRRFLAWVEDFAPDMLWLHNIHGYYINIEMLFDWIKSRPHMQVRWTLHDCWAFTGHCAYFTFCGCERWRTGCEKCPQRGTYPASMLVDGSRRNYARKKAAFTGVNNMTLITPSEWLAALVRQSFLHEYPVQVSYNRVDETVFKPTESDFRQKHGLQDKIIVLGVASPWSERKGLGDFVKLAAALDERYAVVLVGLDEKQRAAMPPNVLPLPRTDSPQTLAAIYTAADVFVNASVEETFGMTTVEAISCGTPAIVYKNTACEEIVGLYGGTAVERGANSLVKAIEETRINSLGQS